MAYRRFADFAALAEHFEAVASRLPAAETAMLHFIGAAVQKRAQAKIGHYQPGWAPLAETTLEGWRGFPGKIELGYAPPDNPLLRTGYMRNSISWEIHGPTVIIGDADPKSLFHELGTSKMPARPFIGPAMIESEPEIILIIGRGVRHTFQST